MKTNDLLTRAVAKVIPAKLAEEKLQSGKQLRIYWGIDPTGSKLHLGHAVPLRKLQAFVNAGHEVIVVIGSFTAMIGDPSGRDELRQPLTREQVEENFRTYKKQAAKILDFSKVTVRFNHEWLEKLTPELMVKLASHFTKQQMEQREMFARREKEGKPIHLSEFIYPLLVGYDSVILDVDCELGGTDQEFNMLCGRHLQQVFGKREKFVLMLKLLEGTDGRKMSKTYGNCIFLEDSPSDMFGKLMSINDDLMETYFECCTDVSEKEYKSLLKGNPRDAKAHLAREIVTLYHGKSTAEAAEKEFTSVFSKGELPKDIPEQPTSGQDILGDLVKSGLVSSKSDARRLLREKGIKLLDKQGNTILVTELESELGEEMAKSLAKDRSAIIKIGKKKFLRFVVSKSFTDIFPGSVPNYPPKA